MARSRRETIQRYADPGYEIPEHWTTERVTLVELRRIAHNAMIARIAVDVPRRLGGDASGYELAADKKLSKRIAYVYYSLWTRFVRSTNATLPLEDCPLELIPPRNWKALHVIALADSDTKREGSTVIWNDWWEELSTRLQARRMVLASLSLARSDIAWGYRMMMSITDEMNWVADKFDKHESSLKRRIEV